MHNIIPKKKKTLVILKRTELVGLILGLFAFHACTLLHRVHRSTNRRNRHTSTAGPIEAGPLGAPSRSSTTHSPRHQKASRGDAGPVAGEEGPYGLSQKSTRTQASKTASSSRRCLLRRFVQRIPVLAPRRTYGAANDTSSGMWREARAGPACRRPAIATPTDSRFPSARGPNRSARSVRIPALSLPPALNTTSL